MRSEEGLTQRATLGAEQLISQRRPCELVLHDVVPPPSVPVLLLVLVVTFVSPLPLLVVLLLVVTLVLLLLLLLTLLSMLMLLELEAAPAPVITTQSRRARAGGNLMMGLQRFAKDEKRGRSPLILHWIDRCTHSHLSMP